MIARIRTVWDKLLGNSTDPDEEQVLTVPEEPQRAVTLDIDIAADDPLLEHFVNTPDAVDIEKIALDSDALRSLKEAGVKMVVPLVSQGEMIGLLSLGPRLSEQEYSVDDRRLLNTLATQAAPALRVAQLARQQQAEARARERIEHELRVARVIQQTLLPKELPSITGWKLAAHWQPAREVSGDFYDFINFPDGRLGIVIGDVTDKGVPAAMVMATTRSMIRANAEQFISPGVVLEKTNEQLVPDIPRNMFVTCLYLVLDPSSGGITYANAGHNLPYKNCPDGVCELRATGMPLGLMPDMDYEEIQDSIETGESVLFYSDGLVEAHNPQGDMFGDDRLQRLIAEHPGGEGSISLMLNELSEFTGASWEQEDDVTFVSLERTAITDEALGSSALVSDEASVPIGEDGHAQVLAEFSLPSEPGNERQAMERVADIAEGAGFPSEQLDQLRTAVAEATMNAMEHGNNYDPEIPVQIKITGSEDALSIHITDQGGSHDIPEHVLPDLDAKLSGEQSPRGWGLFLIENMVDEMHVHRDEYHHMIQLIFYLKEKTDD